MNEHNPPPVGGDTDETSDEQMQGLRGKTKKGKKKVIEEDEVPLLILDNEDFSILPETGRMEYLFPMMMGGLVYAR